MVEGAARIPSEGGVSGPDTLLATKLHVPRTAPGFVPRPRLADRLTAGLGGELTLVCAPAGFGKTALIADWSRRSSHPVAWLSLDAGDNDPVRFWGHAVAALGRARAGIGEHVFALLRTPRPPAPEAVVTALINELADRPEDFTLVLDDYHVIDAQPIHRSLAFLLEYLPPRLRLVLASRSDPPLPLARLRARGQLAELRAADLRFTPEEAAALLHGLAGPDLPAAAVAALEVRTEGWAAGLQLAGLSLRGRADVAAFVETFSGSHRYVLDYLVEEVLAGQPEQVVSFLLETSVLDRLTAGLCNAVTGRVDGQAMLEELEGANLFLVPLDDERYWYRYHHLFAEFLRARLERERPGRGVELHRAAAGWHERHGLIDEAVRHALAAGDAAWAARLVDQHVEEAVQRGEGVTANRWLAALPAELVRSRTRLALARAIRAVAGGQLDEVEPLLVDAERALAADADEPTGIDPADESGTPSWLADVPATIMIIRANLARFRGDVDRTLELARRAADRLSEDNRLRPPSRLLGLWVPWMLGMAHWLRGELVEAEHDFEKAVSVRSAAGERHLTLLAHYDLGGLQTAQGRLGAAATTYRRALALATEADPPLIPAAGMAQAGLAEVLRERNELDAALEQAREGIARCRQPGDAQPLSAGLVTLAWIRQAQGDPAGAREAIAEAERVEPGPDVIDLFRPVTVQRARLLLAQGEVAEAAHWTAERGLDAEGQLDYLSEPGHLLLVRLLLARGAVAQARELLVRLQMAAVAGGRAGRVVELHMLEALALDASGDTDGALTALAEALAIAWPEGCVRVFADEGAPLAGLLTRLITDQQRGDAPTIGGVPPAYLRRVLEAFEPRGDRSDPSTARRDAARAPGPIEPLSHRELEVLRLLAAGRANRQIADDLVVALDTVKKHVSHILRKLDATNRTQAVARATELGLLD